MTTATKDNKADAAFAEMTRLLIEALESGKVDPQKWTKPWRAMAAVDRNPATGNAYRGGNALYCSLLRAVRGWDTPAWSTYKGWLSLGRQVQKGEKSTALVKWTPIESKREFVTDANGVKRGKKILVPFVFLVFNYHQTAPIEDFGGTPWEPEVVEPLNPGERHEAADAAIRETGARVRYVEASPSAYYAPAADEITMPTFGDFKDATAFYATAFHEIGHWTGHTSRLKRDLANRFGSEAYAVEELVAELTSVFVLGHFGLSPEGPREDHAQYLAHWLNVLKANPRHLFSIAGQAQKAADLLLKREAPVEEETPEKATVAA